MHPQSVPAVSPQQAAQAAPADAVLLDVREDDEWALGRAPSAQHIPLHDLPARLDDMPRDRPVAVVCRVGGRSAQATAFLRAHGVDAVNVEGGMLAWAAAGLPLEGDAEPPRVV